MGPTKRLMKLLPLLAALCVAVAPTVQAQDYPARPVTVIVPFAGGSASDVVARLLFLEMSKSLGQTFIVDNRPGAGGNTGTAAATKAPPDGYTLLVSTSGPLAANKTLFKSLGYDPLKDLAPISLFAVLPNVVMVNAKLAPKTLTEFITYAKAHPKALNYGTVGVGSSQHIAALYFEQLTGTQLTHVPYRNIAQYTPDFLAGQVSVGFQLLPNVLGLLRGGEARALAVTSDKRMTALPDVPTSAEAGLNNYVTGGWLALLAPAGTPKPIVDKLSKAVADALKKPALQERFVEQGAEPSAGGPDELTKFMASETVKLGDIITKAGIPPM